MIASKIGAYLKRAGNGEGTIAQMIHDLMRHHGEVVAAADRADRDKGDDSDDEGFEATVDVPDSVEALVCVHDS